MTLARWPNDGFAKIAATRTAPETSTAASSASWKTVSTTRRPARAVENTGDIWVHGYWAWDWANSYEQIASIDLASG